MAAKNKGDGGAGRSNKFRFIMFEGDLSDTNMSELAQAITTALRPAPVAAPRLPNRVTPALGAGNGAVEELEEIETPDQEEVEEVEAVPEPKAKASAGPRTYPKGKVLTDVDLESEVSFHEFAAGKKPNTLQDRYLIAAAWYRLHRDTLSITMHHVYTCFLHPKVKWPVSQADFDQPLRQLVKADRMGRGERSHYVINSIGLADVEMMGGGA